MTEGSGRKTPRDFLRVLFRRRRFFVLSFSLFAVATMLGSHYIPLKYTGTTILNRWTDAAGEQLSRSKSESFESMRQTLKHELSGDEAVERAVDELGLTRGMPHGPTGELTQEGKMQKQDLIRNLKNDLTVNWDVRSEQRDQVSVSFTHADPVLAQRVPNTLVPNYIDRVGVQSEERLKGSRAFLLEQRNKAQGTLSQLNSDRMEFEKLNSGSFPESPGVLHERIRETRKDLEDLTRKTDLARKRLDNLRGRVAAAATTGPASRPVQIVKGPNPEMKRLAEELRQTKDNVEEMRNVYRMTDKHPNVMVLLRKIEYLEKRVKETPEEAIVNWVYGTESPKDQLPIQVQMDNAVSELEQYDRERRETDKQLAELDRTMKDYGANRLKYLEFVKKIADAEAEVDRWARALQDVEMSLAAELAKKRTLNKVELAQPQYRPSYPKLWMVLGFALGGGFAFGGLLVFVINLLDRSIATTSDAVASFNVPIHGIISEIVTPKERTRRRLRGCILTPIVSFVVLAAIGLSTLSVVLWLSYPEQYRSWTADPVRFMYDQTIGPAKELLYRI